MLMADSTEYAAAIEKPFIRRFFAELERLAGVPFARDQQENIWITAYNLVDGALRHDARPKAPTVRQRLNVLIGKLKQSRNWAAQLDILLGRDEAGKVLYALLVEALPRHLPIRAMEPSDQENVRNRILKAAMDLKDRLDDRYKNRRGRHPDSFLDIAIVRPGEILREAGCRPTWKPSVSKTGLNHTRFVRVLHAFFCEVRATFPGQTKNIKMMTLDALSYRAQIALKASARDARAKRSLRSAQRRSRLKKRPI